MSSFKGESIFDSGPHIFTIAPVGVQAVLKTSLGTSDPGHALLGLLELTVTVTGRLLAASVEDLDELLTAVEGELGNPPKVDVLTDNDGHEWEGMSFVSFARRGPVSKGRVVSQGYEAVFVRVAE